MSAIELRLASPDPEERRLAAQALAREAPSGAPGMLVAALGDSDWRVRKEAAQSAVVLSRRDDVLQAVAAALGDKTNIGLRNAAVEALVSVGPEAVPAAIHALRTLDADGKKLAVEVLGGIPDARGTEALVVTLTDPDPNVRQAAAEALGGAALAGDDARKAAARGLRATLVGSEPMMKLAALDALARLEIALDWREIAPLMSDPFVRGAALGACGRCPEEVAGEALVDALFDANASTARGALVALAEWVRTETARGLPVDVVRARLQSRDGAARVRALDDADASVRGAALLLLATLGDADAAPDSVRGLLDPALARDAETALSLLGPTALGALLAVGERELPARHAALLLMVPGLASRLDDRSLAVLRATLSHESDDVVAAAAQVLGALGDGSDIERLATLASKESGRASRAAATAIDALADRHPDAARAAFAAIARDDASMVSGCVILAALRDGADATHVDYLKRALAVGDARARRAAIEALAAIGGQVAKDQVAGALADEEREVQLAAIRALGRLRHAAALSDLVAAVSDPEIVAAACGALSEADPERSLAVCAGLVTSEDPAVAGAAVSALGKLERARAQDALFSALEHPNEEIVKLALSELGESQDARTLARIGLCLDHASWDVRRLAAELLGAEGGAAALDLLRARLEREADPSVREAIMLALSHPFGERG